MLVHLHQFYILLIAWMLTQCEGCDTGWFGEKCEFLCHCLNNQTCGTDGQCPNNEPCEQGFFGRACQYVDVLQLTASNGTDQFLRDGNDTTCNPQPNATVVVVNLTEAVPFTWFRVALKDNKNMLNFTTTLNGGLNCTNERKFPVNDTLVDVICKRGTMMTSLQISGPAAGSICSLYISGGRNVALSQTAKQTSTYEKNAMNQSQAINAVDGNTDTDFDNKHCSSTDKEPQPNWWSLKFSMPQIIHKVVIYSRAGVYTIRLRVFKIETFDKDDKKIAVYDESYDPGRVKYEVNISATTPISSFKLTKIHTNENVQASSTVLTLCEVQAFGDPLCPADTYGFYCEEQCQCNETLTCSPFSGVCGPRCQPGFYGNNCSSRCGPQCSSDGCEFQSGNCFQCTPGYHGINCTSRCDEHCFGDVCEFQSGNCFQCTPGYHGLNCTSRCGEHCFGEVCEFQSGNCFQCTPGYHGLNCSSRCGQHCFGGTCEFQSGDCFQCTPGYSGAKCDKSCDSRRYGPACSLTCSPRCSNVCNNTNGHCLCKAKFIGPLCTECAATFYGGNCEHMCSDLCGNKLCDNFTGECLTCVGDRIGPFCQDCPWKFFGPLCGSKCNPHCLNGTCDNVSGGCLGCEEGYEGSKCWKIEQKTNWLLLLLLPLLIALFLLIFCCKRRAAKTEEVENPDIL